MEDSSEDLDVVKPPETPDADGLTRTASEFQLVAARAKDPLIDLSNALTVAAMTMIFGTRRKYRLLDPNQSLAVATVRYGDPYMSARVVHS